MCRLVWLFPGFWGGLWFLNLFVSVDCLVLIFGFLMVGFGFGVLGCDSCFWVLVVDSVCAVVIVVVGCCCDFLGRLEPSLGLRLGGLFVVLLPSDLIVEFVGFLGLVVVVVASGGLMVG